MPRYALFFDWDGTLATGDAPPSDRDMAALRRMRQRGHILCLCTGRTAGFLPAAVADMPFDGRITGAGATVIYEGQRLYETAMAPGLLRRVIRHYLDQAVFCALEGVENMYVMNKDGFTYKNYTAYSTWPVVTDETDFEPGVGRFAGQPVQKYTAYTTDAAGARRLFAPELTVIDHHRHLEVVLTDCHKADGMRRILEAAGLPASRSIAFGDSANDREMLRYAGIGVAMGQAPAAVRETADRVTGRLEESGVAGMLAALESEGVL